ncbi:uncharacterized protein [Miscanthus floridulus]|uniref:uncharacterized protein n=1 Tax=Miscanthus floridulus TaxID=154761 RepID=UPI003459BC47
MVSSDEGGDDLGFYDVWNRIPHFGKALDVAVEELRWLLVDAVQIMLGARPTRLGFDPTVSSYFRVIEYAKKRMSEFVGVGIYSSKSAAWMFKEFEWGEGVVSTYSTSVFLNGSMHWLELSQIVVVDMDGKTWRKIYRPCGEAISIHEAQGQLCLCTTSMFRKYQLLFWILEDYGTDNWTLKQKVTTLEIFGWDNIQFGYDIYDVNYRVIAVHLELNLIFLVGEDKKLITYDMNLRKFLVLPAQVMRYHRPN